MRILLRLCLVTVLLLLSAALARAGTFGGVDLMSATVMQKHQSSFSGLAARARLTSARIVEGFELLPFVEYWRTSTTVDAPDITVSRKDATLGEDVPAQIAEQWENIDLCGTHGDVFLRDLVVILTDHGSMDWNRVIARAQRVFGEAPCVNFDAPVFSPDGRHIATTRSFRSPKVVVRPLAVVKMRLVWICLAALTFSTWFSWGTRAAAKKACV